MLDICFPIWKYSPYTKALGTMPAQDGLGTTMTEEEIQTRTDKLAAAMMRKGLAQSTASAELNSNSRPCVNMHWKDARETYGTAYSFNRADTLIEAFEKAEHVVDVMPDPAARKLHEFMGALGKVIDLGRDNGIEVEFLNPLVDLSKRLSENAITHQSAA